MDWNYLGIIIAVAGTGLSVVISVLGLFLWSRGESSSDRRATEAILKAIHDEIKDFHGRLCKIEEDKLKSIIREK